MTKHVLAALVLALVSSACGSGDSNNAPPITDTVTAGDTSATMTAGMSETGGGHACQAFIDCAKALACNGEQDCLDHCAEQSGAGTEAGSCKQQHCDNLLVDCETDPAACTEYMSFCPEAADTSGSSSSSSSESSSSETGPGICAGYFACTEVCDLTPQCMEDCAGLHQEVDGPMCEAQRCDDLAAQCPTDPEACMKELMYCLPDDTSSTGSGSGSSSTTTDGSTSGDGTSSTGATL